MTFFSDLKIIMTQGQMTKKKKLSKKPSETTIPEEGEDDDETETVDDSESAMDGSVDEEDAQDAFVRVLSRGIKTYEDENEEATAAPHENLPENLHEAQTRIGSMLGEMLFDAKEPDESSKEKSTENSAEKSIEKRPEESTGTSLVIDYDGARNLDEEDGILYTHTEGSEETTGLLTGEPAPSLTSSLRPSIFTTISERQSLDDLENAGEKNEGNSDTDEGKLSAQDGRDAEKEGYTHV